MFGAAMKAERLEVARRFSGASEDDKESLYSLLADDVCL